MSLTIYDGEKQINNVIISHTIYMMENMHVVFIVKKKI